MERVEKRILIEIEALKNIVNDFEEELKKNYDDKTMHTKLLIEHDIETYERVLKWIKIEKAVF